MEGRGTEQEEEVKRAPVLQGRPESRICTKDQNHRSSSIYIYLYLMWDIFCWCLSALMLLVQPLVCVMEN